MAKTNITEFSNVASNNTDINNVNIDENCPASNLNNALRELMKALKDVDTGSQALTALSVAGSVTATTSLKTPLIEFTDGDNALTIADGGNVTANADLTVSGASTLTGALSAKGGAVFNEDSADVDFRVESNGDANCLFVDGANDKVGIGTNAPDGFLTINKNTSDSALPSIRLIDNSDAREAFVTNQSGDLIMGVSNSSDDTVDSSINILTSNILFKTANTERMRILGDGRVCMNRSSGNSSVTTSLDIDAGSNIYCIVCTANPSNGAFIRFHKDDGNEIGSIDHTASVTRYLTSSDHRLKENVEDMTGAIDRVKQLLPKRFNFIADDTNTLVDGFLAHEAQSVVAEAVSGTHNEVDDDNNPVMQGIDQAVLVPLLTGALKEAITKIEALETANTALEARITALENA